MLGRWAIVLLTTLFPYGRPAGLGLPLKLAASPGALVRASALPGIVGLLLWPIGLPLALGAALTAGLLGSWLMRQLPGLTGDCYGAGCEVVETLVLIGAGPLARGLG
jgi:adenosylcobinamide-GDP ribazoletransferase